MKRELTKIIQTLDHF